MVDQSGNKKPDFINRLANRQMLFCPLRISLSIAIFLLFYRNTLKSNSFFSDVVGSWFSINIYASFKIYGVTVKLRSPERCLFCCETSNALIRWSNNTSLWIFHSAGKLVIIKTKRFQSLDADWKKAAFLRVVFQRFSSLKSSSAW